MVDITHTYDDSKIITAFKQMHPEISFGPTARVTVEEIDGKNLLSFRVKYPLTDDEKDTILQASRTSKTRAGVIL